MRKALWYGMLGLLSFSNAQSSHEEESTSEPHISNAPSISTRQSSSTPPAASTLSNATCVSRTANYITHTLPQQCLRTDRVAANGTTSTAASPSSEATDTTVSDVPTLETVSDSTEALKVATVVSVDHEAESDSILDDANFLSFEQWKQQNQAKADQAAELPADRQRPGINNALDSLGDEGEIELDFEGFGGGATRPRQQQAAYRTASGAASAPTAPESYTPRSKDAGKTCKERTNYASFDCAATVLKNNPECKSASSVLVENKDSYLLNICSATNKFLIVELCNDILIDTVVLANYEFFSSIFRHFRVSVSERYPVKLDKWIDLGTFEARNSREVQAFLIQHPQIWARYLRIEFLSHYGSEYYCPVSLLRVHGTTMLEELRPQEDAVSSENEEIEASAESEALVEPAVPQEPLASTDEAYKETLQAVPAVETKDATPEQNISTMTSAEHVNVSLSPPIAGPSATQGNASNAVADVQMPQITDLTCAPNLTAVTPSESASAGSAINTSSTQASITTTESTTLGQAGTTTSAISTTATNTASSNSDAPSTSAPSNATVTANATSSISSASHAPSPSTTDPETDTSTNSTEPISSSSTRFASSATTNIPQPQPSTQESFFKSIHKRLQNLEANSTLSLQYIESQSLLLRAAFQKVEKRQLTATTAFLSALNDTVMAELRGFRQAYDQLWQSTVIELEAQREQSQREMLAISSRLTLVADELVWQKRMGIVQSTVILLCLGLVLFARGGGAGNAAFEVPPLMQQMMRNKSQTAFSRPDSRNGGGPGTNAAASPSAAGWENTSPPASPSPESRSPVALFRRKLAWRSVTEPTAVATLATDQASDDLSRPASRDGLLHPSHLSRMVDVTVDPPTPERNPSSYRSEDEEVLEDEEGDDEEEMYESTEWHEEETPTKTGVRERHRKPPDLLDVDD
ncbi:UNC-like C-terminal-domain-containing protein [Neohortaea acidophila]|uniref:UNC-like C-terminal-domain-containing protein n=1 Tax=Neohortaea acidophila TaxID=245834 RepID=A0A6A6PWT2_9PEZI|nr:UNC-like C-terminal-domain-containing protein [Neohortaea acidophila]KAF2484638.1 UNC-like C-terminal-domain-containing protein [Neohortaea acidophila]